MASGIEARSAAARRRREAAETQEGFKPRLDILLIVAVTVVLALWIDAALRPERDSGSATRSELPQLARAEAMPSLQTLEMGAFAFAELLARAAEAGDWESLTASMEGASPGLPFGDSEVLSNMKQVSVLVGPPTSSKFQGKTFLAVFPHEMRWMDALNGDWVEADSWITIYSRDYGEHFYAISGGVGKAERVQRQTGVSLAGLEFPTSRFTVGTKGKRHYAVWEEKAGAMRQVGGAKDAPLHWKLPE